MRNSRDDNKTAAKKLSLNKATLRNLGSQALEGVAGGAMNNSLTKCYASGCTCSGYWTCR